MFVNLFDYLIGVHPYICNLHAKTKTSARMSQIHDNLAEILNSHFSILNSISLPLSQ